jgi:predicted cupin superfamily sugar epimerase
MEIDKMISVEDLIKKFDLKKHPEGGYFAESYRSSEFISRQALPSRYDGDRSFSTAIYLLLPAGTVSRLHRIASDEIRFHLPKDSYMPEFLPAGTAVPSEAVEAISEAKPRSWLGTRYWQHILKTNHKTHKMHKRIVLFVLFVVNCF